MRNKFDMQLERLNSQLTHMGEMCEIAITRATKALEDGKIDEAKSVQEADEEIDQLEKDIERLCLKLLLQQQPVARDLRQISAALKMITDMERIGKQLIDYISKNSGEGGKEAIDLIMVAKYLERIADHATNIAEWVEFSITGIHKESKV